MSYYFDMSFWHASNLPDALEKAHALVKQMSDLNLMKFTIKDNIYFAPSVRLNADSHFGYVANKNWLYSLFNYRFVFWEKHNLLGLVGILPENGPKADGIFYFQNSCCQNYDFDEYPLNIPFFKNKVEKFEKRKGLSDFYKDIFDTLCLDDWLYGRDNPEFERFSFNAIQTSEQLLELSEYTEKLLKKIG